MSGSDIEYCETRNGIIEFLRSKSEYMTNYVLENEDSKFLLVYKFINHSDLPAFGKSTRLNKIDKNYLYYHSPEELIHYQEEKGKPFCTAHQSNIGISVRFWEALGMTEPRKLEERKKVLINQYADCFLVNDSLRYFSSFYTRLIIEKLHGTNCQYKLTNSDIELEKGPTTPIQITQAVHGIGTSDDEVLKRLRHHIFATDILSFLIEATSDGKKKLYLIPSKNPLFFKILQGNINNANTSLSIKNESLWEESVKSEFLNENLLVNLKDDDLIAVRIVPTRYCSREENNDPNNGIMIPICVKEDFQNNLFCVDESNSVVLSSSYGKGILTNDIRKNIESILPYINLMMII